MNEYLTFRVNVEYMQVSVLAGHGLQRVGRKQLQSKLVIGRRDIARPFERINTNKHVKQF